MGELQDLVDGLAERLGRPVAIEDRRYRVLAYSAHVEPPDRVRLASILTREAPTEVADWLDAQGLPQAGEPVRLPAAPDLGMGPRVAARAGARRACGGPRRRGPGPPRRRRRAAHRRGVRPLGASRVLPAARVARRRGAARAAGAPARASDADTLVATLEAYLDRGGDVAAVAAALHIHRTSLYHRLRRIEAIAQASLGDGDDRLRLHIGLRIRRLRALG